MVISCSAYGCKNKWSRETFVHFHKFPFRSEKLCRKWISALKRKDFTPTSASLVCSDHFKKEDYVLRPGMIKKRLKPNAVPSVFKFPTDDFVLVEYLRELFSVSSTQNCVAKRCRQKRVQKRGRKKKSVVESLPIPELNQCVDEFEDTLIEEVEIYESNDDSDSATNDELRNEKKSEDHSVAYTDKEDECSLLGSRWSERLRLLPLDVRIIVRQMIDRIFEEALMSTYNEGQFVIV